jgi:hypothetical protein
MLPQPIDFTPAPTHRSIMVEKLHTLPKCDSAQESSVSWLRIDDRSTPGKGRVATQKGLVVSAVSELYIFFDLSHLLPSCWELRRLGLPH